MYFALYKLLIIIINDLNTNLWPQKSLWVQVMPKPPPSAVAEL